MTSHRHAAVWLDHDEARIFHVDLDGADEKTVPAPHHHIHRHPKGAAEPHKHPDDLKHYFADLAKALADVEAIVLLGPSTAKLQFVHYAHDHAKALAAKIVGLETVDHPTDAQIVAYAKKYFRVPAPRLH